MAAERITPEQGEALRGQLDSLGPHPEVQEGPI